MQKEQRKTNRGHRRQQWLPLLFHRRGIRAHRRSGNPHPILFLSQTGNGAVADFANHRTAAHVNSFNVCHMLLVLFLSALVCYSEPQYDLMEIVLSSRPRATQIYKFGLSLLYQFINQPSIKQQWPILFAGPPTPICMMTYFDVVHDPIISDLKTWIVECKLINQQRHPGPAVLSVYNVQTMTQTGSSLCLST